MKKIMALSKGTGEMFRILWQSGRGLTVMLVVNSLIRNALWPVRALVVKDMVNLAAVSWGQGSAGWQGNFMMDAALFFACFCANRVWWPLNSYVQTLLLARLGHESRVRIMAAMNGVGLSFFDCAENRDIYERALRQADDRQPINTVNSVMGFVALLVSFSTAFFAMAAVSVPVTVLLLASSIPSIIWEGRFAECAACWTASGRERKKQGGMPAEILENPCRIRLSRGASAGRKPSEEWMFRGMPAWEKIFREVPVRNRLFCPVC